MENQAQTAIINDVPYTLDDFIHGRPERIVQAGKSPRLLLVWQHGNEELGPRVAHHIFTRRPDLAKYTDYLCGDPQAAAVQGAAAQLGYDVNRSYEPVTTPHTYSQERAKTILDVIREGRYDFVLDLHTSISQLDQFFIIGSELTTVAKTVIAASPTTKVVAMPRIVTQKTLIGYAPNAVAFECNERFAETPGAMQEIIELIEVLVGLAKPKPQPREIFYVDGLVPKNDDPGQDAQNFKLCHDGYYPILLGTGKHSYRNDPTKDYVCFRAERKQDIVL